MVGHQQLGPLIHDHTGRGDAAVLQSLELLEKRGDMQGHAVSDDVRGVGVKDAGGELVQGEFTVVADDGVTGVRTALKADDHVGLLGKEVGDLALSLVAPVCANNCFDHNEPPAAGIRALAFSRAQT